MNPPKFDRADAAVCLQRSFRRNQARKNVKIQPIRPGMIHVRIHGGENTFCRVGIDLEARRDEHGKIIPRTLDILSVDPRLYRMSLVGGDRHFNPISSDNQARKELLGGSPCNVFITGGNFNTLASGKTFEGHPPHRPIGPDQNETNV